MTPVLELSRDDDIVLELLAPYSRVEPVTLPRRPARRWRGRLAIAAVAIGLTGAIAAVAVAAGTDWLVGAPAPATVQSDFGSFSPQLGKPVPGKAVLVASSGDYQLYATVNDEGGVCTLVSTPWNRPTSDGGGGACSANTPDAAPFWAGVGGMSMANSASTIVVAGHTTAQGAASVHFDAPNGQSETAAVNPGGFFIAGMTVPGSQCDWGAWTPRFTVLDANGQQLSTASVSLLPGASKVQSDRGTVCVAQVNGPFGPSAGQLNPSR